MPADHSSHHDETARRLFGHIAWAGPSQDHPRAVMQSGHQRGLRLIALVYRSPLAVNRLAPTGLADIWNI